MQFKNNDYHINSFDIKMMNHFFETFPDCRDVVEIVINKLQHKGGKDLVSDLRKRMIKIF